MENTLVLVPELVPGYTALCAVQMESRIVPSVCGCIWFVKRALMLGSSIQESVGKVCIACNSFLESDL